MLHNRLGNNTWSIAEKKARRGLKAESYYMLDLKFFFLHGALRLLFIKLYKL